MEAGGLRCPGAGVQGGRELPHMGAGNGTLELFQELNSVLFELSLQPVWQVFWFILFHIYCSKISEAI